MGLQPPSPPAADAAAPAPDAAPDAAPDPEPPPRTSRLTQWTAALLANMAAVSAGAALGWTAPALPLLQREEGEPAEGASAWLMPDRPFTEGEAALCASLVPLGALASAVASGAVAQRWGLRRPLLALAAIFLAGWALVMIAGPANMVWLMLVGRAAHGLGVGVATTLVPRYSDQVAEVAIRGSLGVLLDFSLCNGVLLVYALGLPLPYVVFTPLCAAPVLVFAVAFFFMPESPVHLARVGRREEALSALAWLRPGWSSSALQRELSILLGEEGDGEGEGEGEGKKHSAVAVAVANGQRPVGGEATGVSEEQKEKESLSWFKDAFRQLTRSRTDAKGVFITYSLMFLQQALAISAVVAYATQIFEEAESTLSPSVATLVLGVLQSASGGAAALCVDKIGRRPLLLISCLAVAVCLGAMALAGPSVGWLPPVALGAYTVSFELGIGPLPWFITAELAGTAAGAGAVALNWATAALVTQVFPTLVEKFTQRAVFAALGVMAVAVAAFVYVVVPETRGKPRAQLRRELKRWPRRPRAEVAADKAADKAAANGATIAAAAIEADEPSPA